MDFTDFTVHFTPCSLKKMDAQTEAVPNAAPTDALRERSDSESRSSAVHLLSVFGVVNGLGTGRLIGAARPNNPRGHCTLEGQLQWGGVVKGWRVLLHRERTASAPGQLLVVKFWCPIPRRTHPNGPQNPRKAWLQAQDLSS